MKYLIGILMVVSVFACTTTPLVENWKNPHINAYVPGKVLIVGMTSNLVARQKFETRLKSELEQRGAEAEISLNLFEPTFTTEQKSEKEIKIIEQILIANGFDTVLFSKIIGVEDKISYRNNFDSDDETFRKFNEDYLKYQDIFYNPDYYNEYKVYHAETSMYCICPDKDRELIWKGYIDIVDPKSIDKTVDDYVKMVLVVLEEQDLIPPKTNMVN